MLNNVYLFHKFTKCCWNILVKSLICTMLNDRSKCPQKDIVYFSVVVWEFMYILNHPVVCI